MKTSPQVQNPSPENASETASKTGRRPYVKPAVERVQLLIEEAVLGTGCKSSALAGFENPCQEFGPAECSIPGT